MTSSTPYLLRALYEWILDNDMTPLVVVRVDLPGVSVPQAYVEDNGITLNISPSATQGMLMDNEALRFSARFGGMPQDVFVPMSAVMGVFSRETGQGMSFAAAPGDPSPPDGSDAPDKAPSTSVSQPESLQNAHAKRPALRVVK